MSKKILTVVGPLITYREHPPRIIIRRGWWCASVAWDPGRLHPRDLASLALRDRLNEAGTLKAIDAWVEQHASKTKYRMQREGCVRYGGIHGLPPALADEAVELVRGFLARAVAAPLYGDGAGTLLDLGARTVRADPPGFIIPWVYFGASYEPFTVIVWTGRTRERASEDLDSPEWEGIAPDGERQWFSGSDSALLKPEGRKGREMHRWLAEERAKLLADLTDELAQPRGHESAVAVAERKVIEAAERWHTALSVSIEAAYGEGGDKNERGTLCYNFAECDLTDAITALWLARGEPVGSDRVLPSYGDLEREAQQRLDP